MIFYCVVREIHDDGKAYAWITNHAGSSLLQNTVERKFNDRTYYRDFFEDKAEAIALCDKTTNKD